jgi:hypothetical protein
MSFCQSCAEIAFHSAVLLSLCLTDSFSFFAPRGQDPSDLLRFSQFSISLGAIIFGVSDLNASPRKDISGSGWGSLGPFSSL